MPLSVLVATVSVRKQTLRERLVTRGILRRAFFRPRVGFAIRRPFSRGRDKVGLR